MDKPIETLAKILGVNVPLLDRLERVMNERTKKKQVLERLVRKDENMMNFVLAALKAGERSAERVTGILRQVIFAQEKSFFDFLQIIQGQNEFEKAATLSRKIARVGKGFFLKKKFAEAILLARPPHNLLSYLGYKTVGAMLKKHDVTEAFSALRFIESDEWMHATFEAAYSKFTAADFEEREIEIKVLGSEWHEVAKKFVEKKHHNVSHLKEFGVIFLNPIKEDVPGKFLRDFALLLHYFHEIEFYSKLFQTYSSRKDFSERLKSLLRGDVPMVAKLEDNEWLIVQRYLAKENPNDPRLFMPRVNPESLHWMRGERDLTLFRPQAGFLDLNMWHNLDWVGGLFKDGSEQVVSFDLEDNAMSLVAFMEGKQKNFNYHQREAMWTKIFIEYAGGEEEAEKLLIENFEKGIVTF